MFVDVFLPLQKPKREETGKKREKTHSEKISAPKKERQKRKKKHKKAKMGNQGICIGRRKRDKKQTRASVTDIIGI